MWGSLGNNWKRWPDLLLLKTSPSSWSQFGHSFTWRQRGYLVTSQVLSHLRILSSWVVAARKKEELSGRGVYLHCHDSRWEGTYFEAGTLRRSAYSIHLLFHSPPPPPSPFQHFLLSTVPALQKRLLGTQDLWAAHPGRRTNFSISETPAAEAKKKPFRLWNSDPLRWMLLAAAKLPH